MRRAPIKTAPVMAALPTLHRWTSPRTGLVGVVTPFGKLAGTYYFGQVLQGIQLALSGTGIHMALFDSQSKEFADRQKRADFCREAPVDGFIVLAPGRDDVFPSTCAHWRMPVVVVGRSCDDGSFNYVDVDNYGGASAMTKYLIRLGHKKIGFLRGPSDRRDAAERESAFRKFMASHHLPVLEKWIVQGDYETRKAFHIAVTLLAKEHRPTAIFASNDLMAYGTIDAARMLGLNVPEDVSVAGFDDLEGSAVFVPPLTTAAQPMKQLGHRAASHLLECLGARSVRPTLHERLSAQLIIRASTAPPARPVTHTEPVGWDSGRERVHRLN